MRLYVAASVAAALIAMAGSASAQAVSAPSSSASLIAANDNRAAGERSGNVLRLRLVVDTGRWQPEGPDGRTLFVDVPT